MLSIIDTDYKSDKDDIFKVLEGALGLGFREPIDTAGDTFEEDYFAAYNKQYSTYAMLAYDSLFLYAYTIQSMINRGEDFNNGKELMDALRSADFTGASGKVKFSEGTNDRSAYGYSVVNYQNGAIVTIKEYDPLNPNMFTDKNNTTILWGGRSKNSPADDWSTTYDCPFAEHMTSIYIEGVVIVICIGVFLFVLTLGLSMYSYKK